MPTKTSLENQQFKPLFLIQVGLLIDRLRQFMAKLKFTLTVLVTSWTEKKQRRQSAGILLALNASLCPLLLAVVALSALLSAPLLPLFTLPIFLVGFPRPQRSWPGPVGTACPCPDSVFYKQMIGSLASSLRTAFARGSLGKWFVTVSLFFKYLFNLFVFASMCVPQIFYLMHFYIHLFFFKFILKGMFI